jgi:hypothetical protein
VEDKNFEKDFIVSQMTVVEEDVRYYIDQLESNERFAIISSASIWAFIASLKWNIVLSVVIWIPTVIVFYLAIKRIMLTKTIHAKTEYLKDIEKKLNLEDGMGWNTFWDNHKYGKWKGNKSYLKWWGRFFWISLFIVNILIAYFVPFKMILV